jgi:hypothetical protein
VTGNSRRERVITSVMSKSIVFGKWDATPICVFEAKVMSRDDALMTTSPEKFGFKSTFHKLHVALLTHSYPNKFTPTVAVSFQCVRKHRRCPLESFPEPEEKRERHAK